MWQRANNRLHTDGGGCPRHRDSKSKLNKKAPLAQHPSGVINSNAQPTDNVPLWDSKSVDKLSTAYHTVHCVHTLHKISEILSTQSIVCTEYHWLCTRIAPGKATKLLYVVNKKSSTSIFLYIFKVNLHVLNSFPNESEIGWIGSRSGC